MWFRISSLVSDRLFYYFSQWFIGVVLCLFIKQMKEIVSDSSARLVESPTLWQKGGSEANQWSSLETEKVFNTKVEGHGIADLIYQKNYSAQICPSTMSSQAFSLWKFWKVSYSTFVRGDQSFGWLGGFCSMTVQIHTLALAVMWCLTQEKLIPVLDKPLHLPYMVWQDSSSGNWNFSWKFFLITKYPVVKAP